MSCGSPSLPNYAQETQQAILGQLQTYPTTYMVNAAASLGQPITINGQTYNFTGAGSAQTAGVVSSQMAQTLLAIQQNYSPQFIQQSLAELQVADPQGYAARQDLFNAILNQVNTQPNRPLAQNLQDQITSTLNSAGQLDARQTQEVQQSVRGGQVARGNYLGEAASEQEAAGEVTAADQALSSAQQSALNYLQAGVSPQDVAYRRMQQSMSNLSNFVNGATPTAEFNSLSGAGNGAAPFNPLTSDSATLNAQQAAQTGAQNALAVYGGQINWAQSQVNPYTAGLTSATNSLTAASNLGWQPWGTTSPPITQTGQSSDPFYGTIPLNSGTSESTNFNEPVY